MTRTLVWRRLSLQRMVPLGLLAAAGLAGAQTSPTVRDPAAFQVQIWAASCMACHGPEGRAEGTGLTIGGRPAQDLLGKLLAYKSGRLPATIMHQLVRGYSDDELSLIANYFSSLK